MKGYRWWLLGFDARYQEDDLQGLPLSEDIREQMLLRPDVASPLSVDSHMWPSHFAFYPEIQPLLPQRNQPRSSKIAAESDLAPGLWLSLRPMRDLLQSHTRRAVEIAIELFAPDEVTVAEYPSSLTYEHKEPAMVPEGSVLFGYDVADAGLWSGLCNCGYTAQQRTVLRPYWAQRINSSGLLTTLDDALTFRELSDARVPSHAPFWVHRVHRLP